MTFSKISFGDGYYPRAGHACVRTVHHCILRSCKLPEVKKYKKKFVALIQEQLLIKRCCKYHMCTLVIKVTSKTCASKSLDSATEMSQINSWSLCTRTFSEEKNANLEKKELYFFQTVLSQFGTILTWKFINCIRQLYCWM